MRIPFRARLGAIPVCLIVLGPVILSPVVCSPAVRAQEPALDEEDEVYEAVAEVAAPPRQATERSIANEELTRVPGTGGDPLEAIEILPGVARSPDGEPILRGAAQHESAAFIDGTSVPILYHFGGLRSVIHPRLVQRVDLYPGNFLRVMGAPRAASSRRGCAIREVMRCTAKSS